MEDVMIYNAKIIESKILMNILRDIRFKKFCISCITLKPSTFYLLFKIQNTCIIELGLCDTCFCDNNRVFRRVCDDINSYTTFDFSYSQFYDICEDLVQHKQYNVSLEPLIIYEEDEDENEGIVPFNEVDI